MARQEFRLNNQPIIMSLAPKISTKITCEGFVFMVVYLQRFLFLQNIYSHLLPIERVIVGGMKICNEKHISMDRVSYFHSLKTYYFLRKLTL